MPPGSLPLLRRGALPAQRALLRVFRVLPGPLRRGLIRLGTPSYTVGCVALLRHHGAVLMLRQRHRPGWSLPGGLLGRAETPLAGLRRELREELGIEVPLPAQPTATLVEPRVRRVDLVYVVELAARLHPVPVSPEVIEVGWRSPLGPDIEEVTVEVLALVASIGPATAGTGRRAAP